MGLVCVRVYGIIATVALDKARQEVLDRVLDANCFANKAIVLKKLPLLLIRHQSRILRPSHGELLYVGQVVGYLLLALLAVLVVDRGSPFLYYL